MPIIAAVGVATPNRTGHAVRIERAVLKALHDAQEEGVTLPAELRQRMRQARLRAERELRGDA